MTRVELTTAEADMVIGYNWYYDAVRGYDEPEDLDSDQQEQYWAVHHAGYRGLSLTDDQAYTLLFDLLNVIIPRIKEDKYREPGVLQMAYRIVGNIRSILGTAKLARENEVYKDTLSRVAEIILQGDDIGAQIGQITLVIADLGSKIK
jgi:hypothetical protein